MDIATTHSAARLLACRIPALQASLDLLALDTPGPARIDLYPDPRPDPGATPTGSVLVAIPLGATVGTIDTDLFQIQLTVPIEAQITGADPVTGTTATWARIVDGHGDWWGDASVSNEAGSGEIKLQTVLLYNGAFCRLTSAVFQG